MGDCPNTVAVHAENYGDVLEVVQALGRVIDQMTGDLRKGSKLADSVQRASVRYELRELKQLLDRLGRLQRKAMQQRGLAQDVVT